MRDERQHFSLRKLSVGLASVLIGITFFEAGLKSNTVKADIATSSQTSAIVETKSAKTNGAQIEENSNTESVAKAQTENTVQISVPEKSHQNDAKVDAQKTTINASNTTQVTTPSSSNNNAGPTPETETSTLDLNKTKTTPFLFRSQLKEFKIESPAVDDLSQISDPSQIDATHFANGTRWTPVGWTRTDKNTRVAKSSQFDIKFNDQGNIDSNGIYQEKQGDPVWVNPSKVSFIIDKNDMASGQRVLVGAIQLLPTQNKQNLNINRRGYSPDAFGGGVTQSTYALRDQNGDQIGYLTNEELDQGEIDIYFNLIKPIKNLATDPSFSLDWPARSFVVDIDNNLAGDYSGYYSAKNHLKYPVKYSVVSNNNVLNYQTSFGDRFHAVTDLGSDTGWNVYPDNSWIHIRQDRWNLPNQATGSYDPTSDNFVFKLQSLNDIKILGFHDSIASYIRIYDANGNITDDTRPVLGAGSSDNSVQKQDNLSALDLYNETPDGKSAFSKQADGSVFLCVKSHPANPTPSQVTDTVNQSYLANVQDPQHYDQILNNTLNNAKGWSSSFRDIAVSTSENTKGNLTNHMIQVTDVTPTSIHSSHLSSMRIVSRLVDSNSAADLELYRNTAIQYLDDDANEKQISSDSLIGRKNTTSDYLLNIPKGYQLSSNNSNGTNYNWSLDKKKITYTFQDDQKANDANPIIIHLSHVKQTVNGDTSTQDTQLTTTHTRTIHFVYSDGNKASDDVAQTVIFTRTATRDMADGALSNFGEWTAHGDYSQINVPVIHGYTPTQKIVAEANADSNHNVSVTVTYNKNVQQITVSYIDDTTGKTLETKTLDGYSGDDTHYSTNESIEGYKQLDYELVSDSSKGADLVLDSDDFVNNQAETVHLKHGLTTTNLEHDITRTIHYVYSDGHTAKPDNVVSLKFTGTETCDNVTKQITETKWNKESQNFPEIASPLIPGYTANQTLISDMSVTPNSNNIVQTVTYNPNKQNIHVTFIDDTTSNTLNTVEKSGYTGDDSGYSTKNDIDSLIAKGYKLVSDNSPKDYPTLHFDSDDFADNQNFTVHMAHDTKESNLNREVTRVIHYVYRDGKPAEQDKTDSINFTGVQKIDKVDGHVISTTWTPENKEFANVNTPILAGYTPDKFNVDSTVVKPDSDSQVVTVTYSPDTQYAKFNYIDDSTENILKQETSHGVTGGRDNYSTANLISYYKNKGFDLVSDDTQGKTLTFDSDDNADQVYAIHFTHGTITIDPQNPGKPGQKLNPNDPSSPVYPVGSDTLTKDVNREIDYIYSDGRIAQPSIKDSITFNNTQKLDKVTGEIISSTWDDPKDFAEIQTPVVEGYTPDKTSVESQGIKHDASPIKVIVTYTADPQHMTVIYRDLTDNRILSQFAKDGSSDEDAHYTTKTTIDGYLADGYLLSSDSTNGKDLIFDHNDKQDQTYYVDFTHGSHVYNPEKPNTKDKVNSNDYLADYNTVISYVDSNGQTLSPNKTVTDEYKRDLTIDSVNGNIIKRGDWNLNRGYSNVENPVINGYITAQVSVKPQDMQKNQTINVVYQKLGQVHLVDNNGKEISKPFSYTQDPTDPTKVLVTKVPSVAGYEQVTFTVDPTKNPLDDTTVIFNAPSTVTVNYVDSVTGKTIHTDTVKGFATHTSNYSTKSEIQNLVDKGYVLTKDNVPTSIKLTEGDTTYLVSFVHGIISVKHDNPQKQGTPITGTKQLMPNGVDTSDLNRNIVRSITVIDPHTGSHITKQVVTLYRDATVDDVTKSITYTNWNTGKWDEFDTPVVAGYTPSQNNVPSVVVTPDTKDSVATIRYTANPQTGKISYVDDSGHEVSNTLVQGKTDEKVAVNPVIPHGWVIADGQTIPTSVVATPNGIPTVSIKIKHGTVEVTADKPKTPNDKMPDGDQYPDGVTDSDLNRDITRTINVVDPHTGLHTTVQTAHLSRNAVVDLVTKAITYGKWSADSWDEFDTPTVAGYTPSSAKVAKSNVDIFTKNTTVDIAYTANPQKGKISYIDENGKEIGTTTFTGKTDEDVQIKPVIPHGWVVVDGQTIPTTVKATADGIPTVSIKIKHGQLVVMPDKSHRPDDKMPDGDNYPKGVSDTDLNKNVTRQIILHLPTGDKQVNQVAKYTRVATIDLVTGKVTYTDWATNHGWDEYVPETVTGYTPSIKKLDVVAKPDKDTKVEISYTAIPSSDDFVPSTPTVPTTPTTPNNTEPEKPSKASKSAKKVSNKKIKKQNNGKVAKNNKVANTRYKGAGKVADNVINSNNASQVADNTISNIVANDNATYNNVAINANSASQVGRQAANNNGQLPQTGEDSDKTTALAGILLASMGIVTAIGVSKRKKRD